MIKILILISIVYSNLLSWDFNDEDYLKLSERQLKTLSVIYMTGQEKGLGIEMVALAIVENHAKLIDNNINHICGVMQIDIRYTKTNCNALESNPYYSAKVALRELLFWKTKTLKVNGELINFKRTDYDMFRMYNVGYTKHKHGKVFVKKVFKTIKIIEKYYKRN
jgi:hypothetical protein